MDAARHSPIDSSPPRVQVSAPTWATSTAPAPAAGAPAVGIQFIMTGVSVAQLNQTQLQCASFAYMTQVPLGAPRLCMHEPGSTVIYKERCSFNGPHYA